MELEDWNNATQEEKQQHRYKSAGIKAANRVRNCDRLLWIEDTAIARKLVSEQFYTPANCDWRGRIYSATHLAFQREDRVRALFLFANGMPIGEEGLSWLKVHVANMGAFNRIDKAPFAERIAWTDSRLTDIDNLAFDPKGYLWWTQADKPFLFLAACMELAAALRVGPDFITRLPVSFDGSCSGLQHLSAMTRASEGELVNLIPTDRPRDIYGVVGDRVRARVEADVAVNEFGPLHQVSNDCLRNVQDWRGLVKRNVMTYSYSSKRYGMSQQHMEDTMRPLKRLVQEGKLTAHPYGEDEGRAAAKYLAKHVYEVIEEVVTLPAQAMGFLQTLARLTAHEAKVLSWTTPSGFPWLNRYMEPVVKHVSVWLGGTRIPMRLADGETAVVNKDRAANGVAPNFVHALDASHLALTVNAAVQEGITNLAVVHDSFGCLAPQAGRFRNIIREQFVAMYENHDVLKEVLEECKRVLTVHNHQHLPPLPVYGPLDLQQTLGADYAFA
jgi:DNA-directed RNA polymerase, mitochondrial